jgi:hypothetical protein
MADWTPTGFAPNELVILRQFSIIEFGSETADLKSARNPTVASPDGTVTFPDVAQPCYALGWTTKRRVFCRLTAFD